MNVLIVGGTGTIGGHAALHLRSLGYKVTIAGRRRPEKVMVLSEFAFLECDYVAPEVPLASLSKFDAVVFTAGHDVRHVPQGANLDEHVLFVNGKAIPRFARAAKEAGVRFFINVGSFYPHVAPQLVQTNAYIRSRQLAVDGILALAGDDFSVCSLDAPIVVGTVPGIPSMSFEGYAKYAMGLLGIPPSAPEGGSNFLSTQSLSEAIAGALEHGESGKAYLLGDENLTFAEYVGKFFAAAGNKSVVQTITDEHPLLPDSVTPAGRGKTVSYEPDAQDVKLLGYRRNDITRAITDVIVQYRLQQ